MMVPIMVVALAARGAWAQHHGDVFITVETDQLVTGLIEDDGDVELPERVFESEFGESGIPGFTDEPGFDGEAGTFEPDQRIGWNAMAGLLRWTGDGFAAAGEETLRVSFASLEFTVEDEPVNGFDLAVSSDGSFHRHLNFLLLGGEGDPLPGVYLLELELVATEHGVESSNSFWIVFNHDADEAEYDAATDWVREHLAGEGACAGDTNHDDVVDTDDLLAVLAAWGSCEGCAADVNEDGLVNTDDLLLLLSAWGSCF